MASPEQWVPADHPVPIIDEMTGRGVEIGERARRGKVLGIPRGLRQMAPAVATIRGDLGYLLPYGI